MQRAKTQESNLLYESEETLIYLETGDAGRQIRKVLRATTPDPDQILQFTNEYEYTKDLRVPGVRNAYALDKQNQQYSLVLEYIEGQTLDEAFVGKNRPLGEVLGLFIALSATLSRLHDRGIIHKDLHELNILWVESERLPVLIDFGIAARLDLISSNLGNPECIKGRLTHLPPEQTGRVNRKVDSRSDLYSLGVTLFLVLTGQFPFQATDPLELVHAHIARNPPLAHHLDPAIPEVLANIVFRLMAKNAEERYQSALGLKADLEKCLSQWEKKGKIDAFALGKTDFSAKFQIPQKLYGRYEEVKTLLKAFERVSRGSVELFLVSGYSGVGKTTLVAEIYKPITEKRGYFAGGKFDQYQRSIPYFAFKQALSEFCGLLLTERKETLALWRERIQASVGENGQVLLDLIPILQTIIGPQPAVARLESQESTNRFNLVFSNFIKAISRPEHPFVLFLDDLQWADAASLNLIRLLVTDLSHACLLVLGAYRDNEVSAGHPLLKTIETAGADSALISTILLRPLREEHLFQLISESLRVGDATVQELTELVYSKTGGNAFFTIEFLKSLNQFGLVKFDLVGLKWTIDLPGIRRREITTNVVDLLLAKIVVMPSETQAIFKIAACIGGLFSIQLLAQLCKNTLKEVLRLLWIALEEGLVVPIGDAYQYAGIVQNEEAVKIEFEFSHDRVQQAAYSLSTEAERAAIHLQIGRFLQRTGLTTDDSLFDLANHLNAGLALLTDPAERQALTRLNLRAGLKARDASAYHSALTYLNLARRLAGEGLWEADYAFALHLHQVAADVEYLNGNFTEAQSLLDACLENARTPLEKANVYFLIMQIQSNTTRYHAAIESARQGLKLLDFDFPATGAEAETLIPGEMQKIGSYFNQYGVEGLFDKEAMTDERVLSLINILDNLSPPTYVSGELNLWVLHVLYKINLTIQHGLTPQGGYAFSELGLVFFILNQYDFAFPSAQLSIRIAEKFGRESPRHLSRSGHLYTNYNLPWVKPISDTFALNPGYYQASLESGELVYAGYLSFYPLCNAYYLGKESLDALLLRLPDALEFTRRIRHDLSHDSLRALHLIMAALAGKTEPEALFDLPDLREADLLAYCAEVNDAFGSTVFYAFKGQALHLLGRMEEALAALETANALAVLMSGCVSLDTSFRLYHALTLLALVKEAGEVQKTEYWAKIEALRAQLTVWASHNPANFEHKLKLVEAEIARLNGENHRAAGLYNAAVVSAEKWGFERELALIHRKAAEFWLDEGTVFYARPHLETARYLFDRMAYHRVVEGLDAAIEPRLLATVRAAGVRSARQYLSQKMTLTTSSANVEAFDLQSVLKAAAALSEEIVLDRLLAKMLAIALENAGGQRAVLLRHQDGQWRIGAEHSVLEPVRPSGEPLPPDPADSLPLTVVNYVVRTRTEVVSARQDEQKTFGRDAYLRIRQPASYLCIPLIFKGEANAILYLEHQTSAEAFGVAGLKVLRMLTSQMAASLENALLYQEQRLLSDAYERYVPREFLRTLGKSSILHVSLGDNIDQDMTVVFCDIRSYSSLSEGMSPEDNFRFINGYLRRVGPVIRNNGGFINHYLGDGFMALFKDSPADAIRATIQICDVLEAYNQQRVADGRVPISVGIGVHTGRVMMGIIGDAERHDANVLSDAVNISSRLEGLTKYFGCTIALTESTLRGVSGAETFVFRSLGRIQVKGKEDTLNVYELVNVNPPDQREKKLRTLDLFKAGLSDYFNMHFAEAAVSLKKVLDQNPEDKAARRYLLNAARYLVEGPSEGWDGVEKMTEK